MVVTPFPYQNQAPQYDRLQTSESKDEATAGIQLLASWKLTHTINGDYLAKSQSVTSAQSIDHDILNQLQRKSTPNLFLLPPCKDPTEIRLSSNSRRIPPLRRTRASHPPPLLLSRLRRESWKHG